MANLKVTYDASANAAYVYFTDPATEPRSVHMYPCDPIGVGGMINLDFLADGRVLGVEVLDARGKLPQFLLEGAERIDRPARGEDFRTVTATKETFNGSEIKLFDVVTAGERLIEFRDAAWREDAAVLVVSVPRGSSWTDASVTINPSRGAVPVAFLAWATEIAKQRITAS
ncbi:MULTISPECIES: DUF2283 domain-containing protein [unclassified Amycolatopsis]|uniref:DUF2283 domain-containing protein n=1 Tax=unclassified Amycolatopsis TaxID=2618356 RepID=UPI001C69DFED|nr:DUF2283 domain-containing protein [Amycolatopsis sp. DSM 110486]QYN22124.1 DUF2283 domain-containing protein [Amycolatopsis sp. DSM 110486]